MLKQFFRRVSDTLPKSNSERSESIDGIKEELVSIKNSIGKAEESINNQNKINWKFVLTTVPLYFHSLAFLAILIGAFKTSAYLNSIDYSSIFCGNYCQSINFDWNCGCLLAFGFCIGGLFFYTIFYVSIY